MASTKDWPPSPRVLASHLSSLSFLLSVFLLQEILVPIITKRIPESYLLKGGMATEWRHSPFRVRQPWVGILWLRAQECRANNPHQSRPCVFAGEWKWPHRSVMEMKVTSPVTNPWHTLNKCWLSSFFHKNNVLTVFTHRLLGLCHGVPTGPCSPFIHIQR